jgi:hypothetical protein
MKLALSIVVSLGLLAAVIGGLTGHRFVLVAKGALAVDSYPVPGPTPIARMHVGERAIVLSCDDLKSYPAVHVRLANGTEGYVVEDGYELIAAPIWDLSTGSPVNFLCPRFG